MKKKSLIISLALSVLTTLLLTSFVFSYQPPPLPPPQIKGQVRASNIDLPNGAHPLVKYVKLTLYDETGSYPLERWVPYGCQMGNGCYKKYEAVAKSGKYEFSFAPSGKFTIKISDANPSPSSWGGPGHISPSPRATDISTGLVYKDDVLNLAVESICGPDSYLKVFERSGGTLEIPRIAVEEY